MKQSGFYSKKLYEIGSWTVIKTRQRTELECVVAFQPQVSSWLLYTTVIFKTLVSVSRNLPDPYLGFSCQRLSYFESLMSEVAYLV